MPHLQLQLPCHKGEGGSKWRDQCFAHMLSGWLVATE